MDCGMGLSNVGEKGSISNFTSHVATQALK